VRESGDDVKIEAWDWRYYAEKVVTLVALIQFAELSDANGADEPSYYIPPSPLYRLMVC
jgi:hypothetical protein